MIEILALCIALGLAYIYYFRHFNHWKSKGVAYKKPFPFFGFAGDMLVSRKSLGVALRNLYHTTEEPLLGFFIFNQPCLMVRDPAIIKRVLVNDFQNFSDRSITSNTKVDPVSCYALFFVKNPDWREIRTKITPVFSSSKIKMMFQLVNHSANEMVGYLNKLEDNFVIDVRTFYQKFTIDTISSCAFGLEAHCFKDEDAKLLELAKKVLNWRDLKVCIPVMCYLIAPFLVDIFKIKIFREDCMSYLKKIFQTALEKRRSFDGSSRNDLLDIIVRLEKEGSFELGGDKLVAQAIQFYMAGFETTSSSISFAMYEIAKQPEVQRKLRQEIEEISRKHNGISYDSIKEMIYLDMCVKETLRKYPTISYLDRICTSTCTIPEANLEIQKGTPILISSFGLHYDPKYFPEPDKFDPERFSENNYQASKFTYLPFGDGPRNCIGMRFGLLNTKMAIAHTLKHFEVKATSGLPERLEFDPLAFVLFATDPIKLQFSRIDS